MLLKQLSEKNSKLFDKNKIHLEPQPVPGNSHGGVEVPGDAAAVKVGSEGMVSTEHSYSTLPKKSSQSPNQNSKFIIQVGIFSSTVKK